MKSKASRYFATSTFRPAQRWLQIRRCSMGSLAVLLRKRGISQVLLFLVLLAFLNDAAYAQGTLTFVVPAGAEAIEGRSASVYPFSGHQGEQVRQIITPAAQPLLPPEGVWLTSVSFRPNVSPDSAAFPGTINLKNVDIILS